MSMNSRIRPPAGRQMAIPSLGVKAPLSNAGLKLPHERDESTDTTAEAPDPVMVQAKRDIDAGQVDGAFEFFNFHMTISPMKTTNKSKSKGNPSREAPALAEQLAAAQALASAMPYNAGKALDFGRNNAVAPPRGATAHLIAPRLGPVKALNGDAFDAVKTLENSPPVLFDGLVLPDGAAAVTLLGSQVEVMDFISNQYRHGKTILALGVAKALLDKAGVAATMNNGAADPGILTGEAAKAEQAIKGFIAALGKHRHPQREAGTLLQ